MGHSSERTGLPDLSGVHAKLDRAEEQAENLATEIGRYLRRDAVDGGPRITTNCDTTNRRVHATYWDGPLPLRWSAIFGEMLFDLRSALDHLACQLVIASEEKISRDTGFPICLDRHTWKSNAARITAGMTDAMVTVIEDLQPFEILPDDPDKTILGLIHELNRVDKHQLLHGSDMWLMDWRIEGNPEGVEFTPITLRPGGRLEHGAEVVALTWAGDWAYEEVEMTLKYHIAVSVAGYVGLDDDGNEAPIDMETFVKGAVEGLRTQLLPLFAPFFGPEGRDA